VALGIAGVGVERRPDAPAQSLAAAPWRIDDFVSARCAMNDISLRSVSRGQRLSRPVGWCQGQFPERLGWQGPGATLFFASPAV